MLFQKFLFIIRILVKEGGSLKGKVLFDYKDFSFKPAMFPLKHLLIDTSGIKCNDCFCKCCFVLFSNQYLMKRIQWLNNCSVFKTCSVVLVFPVSLLTTCIQNKVLFQKLTIYKLQHHNKKSFSWDWPAKCKYFLIIAFHHFHPY